MLQKLRDPLPSGSPQRGCAGTRTPALSLWSFPDHLLGLPYLSNKDEVKSYAAGADVSGMREHKWGGLLVSVNLPSLSQG